MIKILFICLGNICRSPMAEFIMKKMIREEGLESQIYVESAGTSSEEVGNPVYYLTKSKLEENGIDCSGKSARKFVSSDYDKFDYIIAMEEKNVRDILKILGHDSSHKVSRLLDFTNKPKDIDDPWYTRDFDKAYEEINKGCTSLLKYIVQKI